MHGDGVQKCNAQGAIDVRVARCAKLGSIGVTGDSKGGVEEFICKCMGVLNTM